MELLFLLTQKRVRIHLLIEMAINGFIKTVLMLMGLTLFWFPEKSLANKVFMERSERLELFCRTAFYLHILYMGHPVNGQVLHIF
jgi:hypothetical protein